MQSKTLLAVFCVIVVIFIENADFQSTPSSDELETPQPLTVPKKQPPRLKAL